jgi:hypothetical protein
MCCDAEWKREVVQDHKVSAGESNVCPELILQWDFINVNEFRKTDFLTRLKWVSLSAADRRKLIQTDMFGDTSFCSSLWRSMAWISSLLSP